MKLLFLSLTLLTTTFSFSLNDLLPRQAPGTPQYDCHLACGTVIQLGRTENYCTATNFTTNLSSCLSCANTYDIWSMYGDSVAEAAEACDLPAEPLAANSTEDASSSLSSEVIASATSAVEIESSAGSTTLEGTAAAETGDATATDAGEPSETASEAAGGATATEAVEQTDGASVVSAGGMMAGLGMVAWLVM